jgi:hypothetical protein
VHPAFKQITAALPGCAISSRDTMALNCNNVKTASLRVNAGAKAGNTAADYYDFFFTGNPPSLVFPCLYFLIFLFVKTSALTLT